MFVVQVEMHPMWRQNKLRDYCRDHKIHVSAYSALGGPGNFWGSTAVVDNPIIQSIALKHNATPAQVRLFIRVLMRNESYFVTYFIDKLRFYSYVLFLFKLNEGCSKMGIVEGVERDCEELQ